MILLDDYLYHFLGGQPLLGTYSGDVTEEIRANASVIVARANALLLRFGDPNRLITSGFRPPWYNRSVPNAAINSKHMTGQAIDIADPDGDLDEWCLDHPLTMGDIGLWQEHPAATKGWCHVQTIPPKSGNRTFYP